MYVPGSQACSQFNSETPMPQSWIDRQNAFIESVSTAFDDGNGTLDGLITTLGGNPAGDTVSGASGVPTTGTLDTDIAGIPVVPDPSGATPIALLPSINNPASWAWPSSPTAPTVTPGGAAGKRNRVQGPPRHYRNVSAQPVQQVQQGPPANCPIIVPLVTAIPIPQLAPAPQSTPAASPAPAAAPVADCQTGNICLDLMNGCVLSSQVTTAQLAACSAAGYAGNRNLFPAIAAKGGAQGGKFLGAPNLNPPPYSPGMSGFGQDASAVQAANAGVFSNVFESIITAVATAAAFAILWKKK